MSNIEWMKKALLQAQLAKLKDEVPIGAVIIKDNQLIGFGHNKVISANDPTAHAEIVAIRQAAKVIGNYRLTNCVMYVTIEPCLMCAGAINHARLNKVFYGASEPKSGVVSSNLALPELSFLNHKTEYDNGILAIECREIIQTFFKEKRQKL